MTDSTPASAAPDPGAVLRVARFFHDPRGSMRALLQSSPREARLLAYIVIASAILLLGVVLFSFHRFLPVLAGHRGFRVEELVVQHRPREQGFPRPRGPRQGDAFTGRDAEGHATDHLDHGAALIV